MSDLAGFYKDFLEGEAGRDFLTKLVAMEAGYQAEGIRGKTIEEKGIAMTKVSVVYNIRSMLDDLKQPPKIKESS
jgi:hypothetical protein